LCADTTCIDVTDNPASPLLLLQNIKRQRHAYDHYRYISLICNNQLMTYDNDGNKIDEQEEAEKKEEEGTRQRWISKGYSGANKIRPNQ
jgi:hypothetical protein